MSLQGQDEILFRKNGALAFVTFNRPHARNALTWNMYDRLLDYCERIDGTDEIRASQFQTFRTPQDALAYEQRIERVVDRLERVRKPTIAMIRGYCVGGGLSVALACDFRYASPDLKMGVPIARTLGNCLSMSNYARIVDLVGPARTKELIMLARMLDAGEALRLGLVNELVPVRRLQGRVTKVAQTLTALAPLTLRATKEAVRRIQTRRRLDPGEGEDLIVSCYTSEDFRSAVAAFLEKRAPTWSGR
ncbi:MAG: enoyl-CoA hydratase [Armatimonadetes bacterium 13_1_40CM_3_65_7]|nr:MAG: enoyl-CoA hydratase [Armatimonadetes bacterium 13_1_40CM_3_65_7]